MGRRLTESNRNELTPREREIEALLCRGYSQENIAAILERTVSTISIHVLRIYRKKNVHTQTGLLIAYLDQEYGFRLPPLPIERKLKLVC